MMYTCVLNITSVSAPLTRRLTLQALQHFFDTHTRTHTYTFRLFNIICTSVFKFDYKYGMSKSCKCNHEKIECCLPKLHMLCNA